MRRDGTGNIENPPVASSFSRRLVDLGAYRQVLVNQVLPSEDYERRTRTEEGRFTETRQKLFSSAVAATATAWQRIPLDFLSGLLSPVFSVLWRIAFSKYLNDDFSTKRLVYTLRTRPALSPSHSSLCFLFDRPTTFFNAFYYRCVDKV